MKIAISVESSADLSSELKNKFNISSVPLTIVLGDEEIVDSEDAGKKIFEFVAKTKIMPKTCAVNEYQFKEYFENLLKNYDEVVHLSMSSDISCTYKNAISVSKNLKQVHIIDTRSLCGGIALLAIYAAKLAKQGLASKEIVQKVSDRINDIQLNFIPNKLDYLRHGGRCSMLQMLGANLLKIHPTITMANGKTGVGKKYLGTMDSCFKKLCEDVIRNNNPDKSVAIIAYTTITQKQLDFAYDFLRQQGFEEIYDIVANGTISSHCGESAMGIMFLNNKE